MHWLEDWGCRELSNERGPLTTPEMHNHQPITNQLVSQQMKRGLVTTLLQRRLEGMENVDKITVL